MSERNPGASSGTTTRKKPWLYVLGGTALLLLGAGFTIQFLRPSSAFPEDGGPKPSAAGRTSTNGAARKEQALAMVEKTAITEAEVNAEIAKISKKFNMAIDQWLTMLQAERNVNEAQYRRDIIWPMIALRKLAGEEIKVTKSELKRAFERHYGEKVKAKAIFLNNSRRANDIWEEAQAHPENFEQLVRQHSIDPQSRPLDGLIQPIARYSGNETLEKAAFALKEGDISPLIQIGVDQQYVILKCEGRTVPVVAELNDEIREILYEQIYEEKVQTSAAEVFKKLKSQVRVDNYLTNVSTGGERNPSAGREGKDSAPIRQTGAAAPSKGKGKRPTSAN
jgi:foldase protein PrsA